MRYRGLCEEFVQLRDVTVEVGRIGRMSRVMWYLRWSRGRRVSRGFLSTPFGCWRAWNHEVDGPETF